MPQRAEQTEVAPPSVGAELVGAGTAPAEVSVARRSTDRPRSEGKLFTLGLQCIPPIVFIAAWQMLAMTHSVSGDILPRPMDVVHRFGTIIVRSETRTAIRQTLSAWLVGLALAFVVGVLLGAVLGGSTAFYRYARFTVDFLRSVPAIALIPLALLFFGTTFKMKIALIFFAAVWAVLIQMIHAVWDIDPMNLEVARSYRLNRRRRFLWITLPSVAPHVATGLRLASTLALLMCVASELLGGAPGLGYLLFRTQQGGPPADPYVYGLIVAVLALIVDTVFRLVERRVLKWHPEHRMVEA